jgi:hypothetical protein
VKKESTKVDPVDVIKVPAVENMLDDALTVIALELAKYKRNVHVGRSLDLKEARVLQGYVKALVELSKENRERAKDEDGSELSDVELMKEMIKSLPDSSDKKDVLKELMKAASEE